MNKLRKKHNRYRILKTFSYLLGFPLLIVMVFFGSLSFLEGDAFANTWCYGLVAVAAMWVAVTVLQIVFSIFTKSMNAKALFTVIVSLILVLGGAVAFDIYAEKRIDDVIADYKEHDSVDIKSYKHQVNHYVNLTNRGSMTDSYNAKIAEFTYIYNIEANSSCFQDEFNADGSVVTYDKKNDVYLSPNGMYADGYVFGVDQAVEILITYHEYRLKYPNADERLDREIKALNSNSEWTRYKNSAEYREQYGAEGAATKLMLNEYSLDALLKKLGKGLADLLNDPQLNIVKAIVDIEALLEDFGLEVKDLPKLSIDKLLDLLGDFGVLEDIASLIGIDVTGLTDAQAKEVVVDGLFEMLEAFSFYQSPVTKPKFDFIADEELKAYAYAKYYGTIHGAEIGSVLIGDRIGKVTMTNSGFSAEHGYSLDELYQLRAENSYIRELYPLFAARRYMYVFAGVIAMLTLLYYHFYKKEREAFDEISQAKAGGMR